MHFERTREGQRWMPSLTQKEKLMVTVKQVLQKNGINY